MRQKENKVDLLNILVPENFAEERKYVIHVIFKELLGIGYKIDHHHNSYYQIGDSLKIHDYFFSVMEDSYLFRKNIPQNISWYSGKYCKTRIPVIYGSPDVTGDQTSIHCHIDIFASAFFMLTRWEEYVHEERDAYQRFPARESLAYKNGFLDMPVVDYYADLLYDLLKKAFPGIERKKRKFKLTATHDIDHLRRWDSLSKIRRSLAHNLVTQKNPSHFLQNLKNSFSTIAGMQKDPYDSFDYIINACNAAQVKPHFFLMSGGSSPYDENYDLDGTPFRKLVNEIKQHQAVIGFHPSYNTINDPKLWTKEKQTLESVTGEKITTGRQHYLRFSIPDTWTLWEKNNMKADMTMGYSELPGFRCGTCHEFSVFDFLNRKHLSLRESPLILMDTTLIYSMKLPPKQAYEKARELHSEVRKFNGDFVFLWHNTNLFTPEAASYRYIYEAILNNFEDS